MMVFSSHITLALKTLNWPRLYIESSHYCKIDFYFLIFAIIIQEWLIEKVRLILARVRYWLHCPELQTNVCKIYKEPMGRFITQTNVCVFNTKNICSAMGQLTSNFWILIERNQNIEGYRKGDLTWSAHVSEMGRFLSHKYK